MNSIFKKIWRAAKPYLNTRKNDIHVEISVNFAFKLLAREGGQEDIVIPAVILHDVGWKKVPPELHLKTFGPKATLPEINRTHEKEGVKIAKDILANLKYQPDQTAEIVEIIGAHDSRQESISLNDSIVKDADKLWRFSKEGFTIDIARFDESYDEGLSRLHKYLPRWFFTTTANQIARAELEMREKEKSVCHSRRQ